MMKLVGGIGSRILALSHMDVAYAGNAGAIAGRPCSLGSHRQFAPGELVEPEPQLVEETVFFWSWAPGF
jgi:hypothetical protein